MRIDITFADRVGIAHEILAVLATRRLNVVGVEVDPPHIYIDAPGLRSDAIEGLRDALLDVSGVASIAEVDMLPGTRRRLHLAAVLAAIPDPVLAVDGGGAVILANAAAENPEAPGTLGGRRIGELLPTNASAGTDHAGFPDAAAGDHVPGPAVPAGCPADHGEGSP